MTTDVVNEDIERIDAALLSRDRLDGATIVVTGCAGFLGHYILQYLVRRAGALRVRKVIGLDTFLLEKPHWVTELASRFPDVLDLRKFDIAKDDVAQVDGAAAATHVIHGASIASPPFYRKYPLETLDANIWGLRRLLDYYRGRSTLRGFLFFSSSEIYGDPDPASIPTPEEYLGYVSCVGPRACYDESKRFGETMCYVFAKQYGMPVTMVRPFNNYGPGMRVGDQRLPADFALCVTENRDIVILSDGTPTRTFCYAADAVSGYLLALLHGKFDVFNIGIERPEIKVRELADVFADAGAGIFGYRGHVRFERSADPEYTTDNPNRRCPRIDKARRVLGYNPTVLVEEGVRRYLTHLRQEGSAR